MQGEKIAEVVLINKLSRIEMVKDDKVKINAKWLLLPQIRHANCLWLFHR
jgi:hypothetical protein